MLFKITSCSYKKTNLEEKDLPSPPSRTKVLQKFSRNCATQIFVKINLKCTDSVTFKTKT